MFRKFFEHRKESSEARRTAKGALTVALELAEKALDGVPIPGVKGAVGGILSIMQGIERTSSNAETLKELKEHVESLNESVLGPMSRMETHDVPESLKKDVDMLVSKLKELSDVWTHRNSRGAIRRYADSASDEGDLRKFLEGIRRAIERFHTSCIVNGRLADAKQEQGIAQLKEHVVNNEAAAILRARSHLINQMRHAHTAAFDSGRDGGPTSCFVGTRITILEKIKEWLHNENPSTERVFWLNGLAGIGKSTIAKTIAEYAHERKILGGSFFYSRAESDLSNASMVFPTLAYQLAQMDEAFKLAIGKALEEDLDYGYRALPVQLEKLIIGPLITFPPSDRRLLFVIDALDECSNPSGATDILRLFLAHASRVPFLFRIFITSRPEYHIRNVFLKEPNHAKFILHDVETLIVRHDIELFLRAELIDIPKRLHTDVPTGWPNKSDLEALLDRSGKLFVYAATALRFIGNTTVLNPQKQMDILMGVRQAVKGKPYGELDQLYNGVLRNALPEDTEVDDIERFHWVVGCIVLCRNPLSMDTLARFTSYDSGEVVRALYHLHSIILTPSALNEAPRVYHPSFVDFITNPQRCTEATFAINIPTHEQRLVLRCLELMANSLKRNIIETPSTSLLNDEIAFISDQVEKALSPEVQYACQYWSSHLSRVSLGDQVVLEKLESFATKSLMWWFEAMSLMNATGLAISCMREAHQWAAESQCSESLVTLLYDAYRFIVLHQKVIKNGALHVYDTALPFTPRDTALRKIYDREMTDGPRVLIGVPRHWSPCLGTVQSRGSYVKTVAFSPDGLHVAIGAATDDHRLSLWDAQSATHTLDFLGHSGLTRSAAFSPDSSKLVTASEDATLRLWDSVSGLNLATFQGHTAEVSSVLYMPDGKNIASGSLDGTIRIWDTETPSCLRIIETGAVHAVAIFPDATRLVSGQQDGSVRILDIQTGSQIAALSGHNGAVNAVAVSKGEDGITRIASGSDDWTVKVWDADAGTLLATLVGHKGPVHSVIFGPRSLASSSEDGGIRMWPKDITSTVAVKLGSHPSPVYCISFSKDGSRIASASRDSTWKLWDAESVLQDDMKDRHADWLWDARTGNLKMDLAGHYGGIYSLAFSSNNTLVASGSNDGTARIWSTTSGDCVAVLDGHPRYVKYIQFIEDDTQLVCCMNDQTFIWDVASSSLISSSDEENQGPARGMLASSGQYAAMFDHGRWIQMARNPNTPFRRVTYIFDEYRITGFGFQRDRLLMICAGGQVLLLDVSRPMTLL